MADFQLGLYPIQGTGAMYNGVAVLVDGAGSTYVAFGNSNEANTNETWADVYKYAQSGVLLERHRVNAPTPYKVDGVDLSHSGGNLVVGCNLHTPGTVDRRRAVASVQIPGYAVRQGMETEEGAAGAYAPSDGGGGGGMDEETLKRVLREQLGLRGTEPSLIGLFAGIDPRDPNRNLVRKGLGEKGLGSAEDALIELLQPEFLEEPHRPNPAYTAKAGQYQALLFPFVKNAAANPLANTLGGQDDWGKARRAELVAIVEEGVQGGK